jgi:streptogramin lyase
MARNGEVAGRLVARLQLRIRRSANCLAVTLLASACAYTPAQSGSPQGPGPCVIDRRGVNSVHEFALKTKYSFPSGITAGPDGNVWFTETGADKIGRITTNGDISEFPLSPASGPIGIVLGPDGNLWVAEAYANKIAMISPAGALIGEYAVPTANSDNRFITSGPDGNIWFTETRGNKIGRITPKGDITEFPLPGKGNSGPQRIIAAPDGNLWFTYDTSPRDAVVRMTPGGVVTQFPIPESNPLAGNELPDGITVGPDGNLWFTELGSVIGVLTLSGTFVAQYPVQGPNSQNQDAAGITLGPDGRVYFTARTSNSIGYIVPEGEHGAVPIPSARALPSTIIVGPDGNLWFTEDAANKVACLAPQPH